MLRRIWQYIVPLRVCMFDINTTIKDQCTAPRRAALDIVADYQCTAPRRELRRTLQLREAELVANGFLGPDKETVTITKDLFMQLRDACESEGDCYPGIDEGAPCEYLGECYNIGREHWDEDDEKNKEVENVLHT